MAPLRTENTNVNPAPLPTLIILTSFRTYIGSTYTYVHIHTHTHTYTLNTGSVIQSVKSISCVSWWEQTRRRRRRLKVSMTVMAAAVCRGQIGSDTVKRSVSSGYCSPFPTPHPPDMITPCGCWEGRGKKWMTTTCLFDCGPKMLVQFISKTIFHPPQSHTKTIAAGRARGRLFPSRKIKTKKK